ncbi:MAG TPA: hypothetical protein VJU61_22885 [Polyangiaceae bacterium]|nr:hypothetical protein [Polyangiaceae bacterium]
MHPLRYATRIVLLAALCSCGDEADSAPAEQTRSVVPASETAVAEAALPELPNVEVCLELGGAPIGLTGVPGMGIYPGDPGVDPAREDSCPAMRRKLGTLASPYDPNGGLCCEEPPWMTSQECEAAGGTAVPDPGGGDSLRTGCGGVNPPVPGATIGWLCEQPDNCFESGLCCRP